MCFLFLSIAFAWNAFLSDAYFVKHIQVSDTVYVLNDNKTCTH
jgi:hypothetical protein